MELNLVVPVAGGQAPQTGDEELIGKKWRVKGPIETADMDNVKFHCVSYVWGAGVANIGTFFDCKRNISNRTKPALEAVMKAVDAIPDKDGVEKADAFWIDAICVPQAEGSSRQATLESMGFIYSKAVSVIVVLQEPAWEVVRKASSSGTSMLLSPKEMQDLESDTWVSRVWTYQEMVNNDNVYFTTFDPRDEKVVVSYEPLMNSVGYSSDRLSKDANVSAAELKLKYPNLDNLTDTLVDARTSGYLERSALGVLSNMANRNYESQYPANRLLASLGALTKKSSWSPAESLSELAEKVMSVCEEVNDYSFIFTSDKRDEESGLRWRPSPSQISRNDGKPANLIPVLSWSSCGEPFGNTQRAHRDSQGVWLDNMIRLHLSEAMSPQAKEGLEMWLYGQERDPRYPKQIPNVGFLGSEEKGKTDLASALFKAFQIIGFTGSSTSQTCENGLFFSVDNLEERQGLELFATSSIRWKFGAPGLAMWKEGDTAKYSAGVFAGDIGQMIMGEKIAVESLLMI